MNNNISSINNNLGGGGGSNFNEEGTSMPPLSFKDNSFLAPNSYSITSREAFKTEHKKPGSTIIFLCILFGQCIKRFNERTAPQDELMIETGSERFSRELLRILSIISPNYDAAFTLVQSFGVFVFALLFYKTRRNEDQESIGRTLESQRSVDTIQNVENMRNYQIQKAVQLIKDYKFKNQMFIHIELLLLTFVSSISCTIIALPYILIFTSLAILTAFTSSEKQQRIISKKLNIILISLLLTDLLVKYFIKGSQLLINDGQVGFYMEIVGLLSTTASYIDFYSKILLLMVQCQRIQYNYDYHSLFKSIKQTFKDRTDLSKLFKKRGSFTYKITKPISLFMFCSISVLFALIHPSILYLCLLPLIVYGFFMKEKHFKYVSKFLVLIICLYILARYGFFIAYLLIPDDQKKEQYMDYLEKILGVVRDDTIYQKIFAGGFDFMICLILAYFSRCIQIDDSIDSLEHDTSRINNLIRNGYEDDMLTIADDVSEVRSKISYKTGYRYPQGALSERSVAFTSRFKGKDVPATIIEDKKEEEEIEESLSAKNKRTLRNLKMMQKQKSTRNYRDETFRGSMRRLLFKVYLKLRTYFDNTLDLLIIHSAKFALFGIFIVSVTHANLFNAGLFLIFLFLSISNYREVQKYWKVPIIFDSLILLSLYAIDVFKPDEVMELNQATLKLIGIQTSQKDEIRLLKYTPYLLLLCILVITHYILNCQRYEEFLAYYNQIEMRDRLDEDDNEPIVQQDQQTSQIGITDKLTKFIIKYSLYIMLIALFVECSLLPVSVLNFILLLLMCMITVKYLKSSNSIELYKNINGILMALKWISLIFIFLKYMFQFEDLAYTLAFKQETEGKSYYEHLPLIEKLLGIENNLVPIKLFSLALVMSISNLQLKFVSYKYLSKILKEQDEEWERSQELNNRFQNFVHHCKIYFLFLSYYAILPLPIILTINYSLSYLSAIGFALFISTIIIIYRQKDSFWRFQHIKIGQIACIALLTTYALQFIFLNININEDFVKWLGVEKQDESISLIYTQLIPLFAIIAVCALQKESLKLDSLFKQTIKQEDIVLPDMGSDELENKQNQTLYQQQQAIYDFESPIRNCLEFKDKHLKLFFYHNSTLISIFVQLCIILYKLNITSLIYSTILVAIFKQKYYPNLYSSFINNSLNNQRMEKITKIQMITLCFIIIGQYAMMMGPAYLFDYISWKDTVANFLCLQKIEQCRFEWQEWLSIARIPESYIIVDLLGLFACIASYFFASNQISVIELEEKAMPKFEDKNDFLSNRNSSKFYQYIINFLFQGFPYIVIAYIMIFAASFHGSGTSDLLSAGYLLISMYYIVNFRKLYTKNIEMLSFLRGYNLIIMLLIILFQTPIFICPSSKTSWNSKTYISRDQCIAEQQSTDVESLGNVNPLLAFYIVFTQSIGLLKVNKIQFDLIVMIILIEVQNQIFSHPYYQTYVLEHMRLDKETDGKLRAFIFVEKIHLSKLWSYKAIKQEIKILHSRLLKINNTIRNQEFSKYLLLDNIDQEQAENQFLLSEENSNDSDSLLNTQNIQEIGNDQAQVNSAINKIIEDFQDEIESISLLLLSVKDIPVVPIKYFIESFRSYLRTREDLIKLIQAGEGYDHIKEELQIELINIIQDMQRQIYNKNRIDLYYKEGLGLNFAIQKGSTDYLKQGDYSFYKHLILSSRDQQYQDQNQNDFEIQENYEENIDMFNYFSLIQNQDQSATNKIGFLIRSYLWRAFVNKLLFYSLNSQSKQKISAQNMSFIRLLGYCLISQSITISYLTIFINFIITPNIISMIPALSILLYALIDFPLPNVRYFKILMGYMLIVVALKFIYQLPIFCGSDPYSIFTTDGCIANPIVPEVLLKRFDFIIGITKFAGPHSFPKDQGILRGLIGDLIVLLSLLVLKNYLIKIGVWHYVRTRNNIYQSPAFKCRDHELTERERLNIIKKENYKIYEYEQASFFGKLLIIAKKSYNFIWKFILKLMPTYMNSQQRNLDLRSQEQYPQQTHITKLVKPGKDYFSANFFTLLLILVYNLFWYRSVIGEQQASTALSTANLQRFSTAQVGVIFMILVLMMSERMLFRVRHFDSQNTNADSGLLGKHQLTIKFVVHIVLVLSVHVYLGFIIPRHHMNSSEKIFPLFVSYILWTFYFVASALQIKHGYPQAPFKPPFTRDTSFFNVLAFRIYKAIPFLWEMKVIVDWTVTATCLDLFQWFKLDDAYNYLYYNKYQIDQRKNRPQFAQRSWNEKFLFGFCFALGLILVILAPILLFSGINPIMVKNPVQQGQLQISFELNKNGNTYSILTSQAFNVEQLTTREVGDLQTMFNPINLQFSASDMQKMHFSPYSESEWQISPPSLEKFIDDFNAIKNDMNAFVEVKSNWVFKRNNPVGNEATQSEFKSRISISKLQPIIDMLENNLQTNDATLINPVNSNSTLSPISQSSTIYVENLLPKLFKLGSSQQSYLLEVQPVTVVSAVSACELTLNKMPGQQRGFYWTYTIPSLDQQGVFKQGDYNNTQGNNQVEDGSQHISHQKQQNLVIIAYNEEVIGSLFGSAFQLSVVGLYATIVVAIGRFLRLIFDRISQRVIYEEMNDIEQLFEICEGIFIAQLEGDLVREKKLYELLIRIYRSPETLIKITEAKKSNSSSNQATTTAGGNGGHTNHGVTRRNSNNRGLTEIGVDHLTLLRQSLRSGRASGSSFGSGSGRFNASKDFNFKED